MPVTVFPPSYPLSDFISYYYCIDEFTSESSELKKRIPDGTVELFFHYGNPFYTVSRDGKSELIKERSLVLGQLQDFIQFRSIEHIGFIGVKFKAHGFQPFVQHAVTEFTDRATDIKDVWGDEARILEDRIAESAGTENRIGLIEKFLLSRLNRDSDPVIDHCTRLIMQNDGDLKVSELAKHVNLSTRQLERKFLDTIGINPNRFSRINRIRKTLISLENNDYSSLTELGYAHGYYDQSHLIKEMDRFAGMTPGSIQLILDCYGKTAFL